jgi:NADH:ubiquinone oxidoreductase subunit 6 (subunit J)
MAIDPIFIVIALFTIAGGLAIFLSRSLLHSVLALTAAFIGSALVFFYLGQSFIALLQLFVFVGGLSTYLIVAVAGEEAPGSLSVMRFVPMLIVIVLGLSTLLLSANLTSTPSGNNFETSAASALASYSPVLFILALLLFSTVLGSIMIMKRFVRLIV